MRLPHAAELIGRAKCGRESSPLISADKGLNPRPLDPQMA